MFKRQIAIAVIYGLLSVAAPASADPHSRPMVDFGALSDERGGIVPGVFDGSEEREDFEASAEPVSLPFPAPSPAPTPVSFPSPSSSWTPKPKPTPKKEKDDRESNGGLGQGGGFGQQIFGTIIGQAIGSAIAGMGGGIGGNGGGGFGGGGGGGGTGGGGGGCPECIRNLQQKNGEGSFSKDTKQRKKEEDEEEKEPEVSKIDEQKETQFIQENDGSTTVLVKQENGTWKSFKLEPGGDYTVIDRFGNVRDATFLNMENKAPVFQAAGGKPFVGCIYCSTTGVPDIGVKWNPWVRPPGVY